MTATLWTHLLLFIAVSCLATSRRSYAPPPLHPSNTTCPCDEANLKPCTVTALLTPVHQRRIRSRSEKLLELELRLRINDASLDASAIVLPRAFPVAGYRILDASNHSTLGYGTFGLDGGGYASHEEELELPHRIANLSHRHRLRRKRLPVMPLLLWLSAHDLENVTRVTIEVSSVGYAGCASPMLIRPVARVSVRLGARRDSQTGSNELEHAMTSSVNVTSTANDANDAPANRTSSTLDDVFIGRDKSSRTATRLPPGVRCDSRLTAHSSHLVHADSEGVVDVKFILNPPAIAFGAGADALTLLYGRCDGCDDDCQLSLVDADSFRFCAKPERNRHEHDCKKTDDYVLIRMSTSRHAECMALALCVFPAEKENELDGSLLLGGLSVPAGKLIALDGRALRRSRVRLVIGYGLVVSAAAIAAFFAVVSRCRRRRGPSDALVSASLEAIRDRFEVTECDVQVCSEKVLSRSDHATVFLGLLATTECSTHEKPQSQFGMYRKVAVKVLHKDSGENHWRRFMYQGRVHKVLNGHPHVVQLLGMISLTTPACLIFQYYPCGDLLSYLRDRGGYMKRLRSLGIDIENCSAVDMDFFVATADLYRWADDIASGMDFLSSFGLVHRNLCASNVLLDDHRSARIGDFASTRPLFSWTTRAPLNDDHQASSLAAKWMAPESLRSQIFTTASDVWSYGVLLFELWTLGAPPYAAIHASLMHAFLLKGNRLPRPAQCSGQLYSVMNATWRFHPSSRPSFSQLREALQALAREDAEDPATPFFVQLDDTIDAGDTQDSVSSQNLSVIPEEQTIPPYQGSTPHEWSHVFV